MVAARQPLVPASYLDGACCLLPEAAGRGLRTPPASETLLDRLTPAERLVAAHVARGLSNKEIAAALDRAEPTIKHQLASALQKLGVRSRCELIVRLLRG